MGTTQITEHDLAQRPGEDLWTYVRRLDHTAQRLEDSLEDRWDDDTARLASRFLSLFIDMRAEQES